MDSIHIRYFHKRNWTIAQHCPLELQNDWSDMRQFTKTSFYAHKYGSHNCVQNTIYCINSTCGLGEPSLHAHTFAYDNRMVWIINSRLLFPSNGVPVINLIDIYTHGPTHRSTCLYVFGLTVHWLLINYLFIHFLFK